MPASNKMTAVLVAVACLAAAAAAADTAVERGRYIFFATGCIACHSAEQVLAGGRPLETPFGTFHPPNITPSREQGIGEWTQEEFERALRFGISPRGEHYYPAFPYPSYTQMTQADIRALYAYLMSLPAASRLNEPHELHWPYSLRPLIAYWKDGAFAPGAYSPDPDRSAQWNRGAYLANALGHCSECHTARGFLGMPDRDRYLAGTCNGPEGRVVPNITPDRATGIGGWSQQQLTDFLGSGRRPDGSMTGSLMLEVLGTGGMRLSEPDRQALAVYLLSLPPVDHNLAVFCAPFDDAAFYE